METSTNKGQIFMIVGTVCLLATGCVTVLCFLSYYEIKVPPELNTLVATLVGYLTGALTKTSPTEATKQVAVQNQPVVVDEQKEPKP